MCPKLHLTTHRAVHFLRKPKTFNEMRQFYATVEADNANTLTTHQIQHLTRPKRNPANLPNAYDDKPVSLWKHSEFVKRWLKNKYKHEA